MEVKKIKGKIIKNISNIYIVKDEEGKEYEALARGKMKLNEIKPVVGDNVEYIIDKNQAVITEIFERKSYLKRPKVSNISQIIFVVSCKMPSVNLMMLDKELCFAEFSKINPIIVINKTDLSDEEADRIFKIYTNVGYKVIKTKALEDEGLEELRRTLKNNTTALAGESGVRKIHNHK